MTYNEALEECVRELRFDFRKLKCDYREVYYERVAKIYAMAAVQQDRDSNQDVVIKSLTSIITKDREIILP